MDSAHDEATIAVTTFRRPTELSACLREVVAQAGSSTRRVQVMVVDNDDHASAREVVASLSPAIRYVHEPCPGVSAARNAALDSADGSAALIFLDDDTVPVPGWLDAVLDLWHTRHPAAITGSVSFSFDSGESERYSRDWGEFDDTRATTGTSRPSAASRNLLLDLAFVRRHGLRFDERLGLIGGEDTLLTRQLVAAGGTILWCDEARVIERVPDTRVGRTWILRRAYRSGGSWAHALLRTSVQPHRLRWRLGARAIGILTVRAASAGVHFLRRRRRAARQAWRAAASQAGVLMICLGVRGLNEYGRRA